MRLPEKKKGKKEIMVKIETLLNIRPGNIPEDRKFLLEFDHSKLERFNIHDKEYCVVTTEATIIAGQRTTAVEARHYHALCS